MDGSGSRGVTRVQTAREVMDKFEEILGYSGKDYLIAEEFVEGNEIGIDLFVYHHEIVLNAVHGKLTFYNGHADVPLGHYFPFEASDNLTKDIRNQIEKVVKTMGFNNCAVNMDVLIRDDKAYIIEASGRAGATCIPELVSKYYGFNYYEKMIQTALGQDVDFESTKLVPCAAKLLISSKSGIIKKQEYTEKEGSTAEVSLTIRWATLSMHLK